jgi:hypothetical protein
MNVSRKGAKQARKDAKRNSLRLALVFAPLRETFFPTFD